MAAWKTCSTRSPRKSSVFAGWAAPSTRGYVHNSNEQGHGDPDVLIVDEPMAVSTVSKWRCASVESLATHLSPILRRQANDHSEAESFMRLDRIYTRGGDTGLTSLADGTRIPKFHLRIAAMGGLDEANVGSGLALLHIGDGETADRLNAPQNDLFDFDPELFLT